MKSELARGRCLQLEQAYLLDVRLLADDDGGGEWDFVCNVAIGGSAAPLRGVCQNIMSSYQGRTDQLEEEKVTAAENSADDFVGITLPDI
ncbi:hypothetical protein Bpfe_009587 [Biomphalaria pfeifferi]|uniref:Uncharacterized protein n=1 Tax=Biomphalaria pfeifferi TaxID=112525 RepID=A0AAD8BWA3_BIOPF|nr:hypothetical protein Bpfe_009587 [Biomphalaria pfeifferi]